MQYAKRPIALALGLLGLTGCQSLTPQPEQPNQVSLESAQPTLFQDLLCTLDHEQHANFTPSEQGNLWPRLRSGFALPETDHARVQTYLNWYKRNPHYIERVMDRGQRYLHYISRELETRDMPMELALLPIVESAFDPFAYSHGRASGIWQFIPGTARQYGLRQNWWYDGRRDPVASTEAALNYLEYLHQLFDGDWLLALAAYNSGQGTVRRAIRRNAERGQPTDFWSLRLPRETRAYVPQLLAISRVVADPEAQGLSLAPIPDKPYFAQVDVGSQIDLAQAADLAGMDLDELYMLNAGYNRWATDPEGPHRLLIPYEKARQFTEALKTLPREDRIGWHHYQVKPGDSLNRLAKRFNTSVKSIQSLNQLKGSMIRAGQPLLIPTATKSAAYYSHSSEQRRNRIQSRSKGGNDRIRISYQVRSGDSFWTIAKRHDTTVGALTNWNGMAPGDTLKPGQNLVIWTDHNAGNQARPEERSLVRKVSYRVRRGDSLARIANKFNLSVKDIVNWNQVSTNSYIHPGQSLTLFVDITQSP